MDKTPSVLLPPLVHLQHLYKYRSLVNFFSYFIHVFEILFNHQMIILREHFSYLSNESPLPPEKIWKF